MDTEILRTMQILAKTKSFSKTAQIMNVVQSTVSTRISELERATGQKLFVRNNQSVTLTESGEFFLPYAEKMTNTLENGIAQINSLSLFRDRIVFGSVYSSLPNILLPVYCDFLKTHPDISVRTVVGHSADIMQLLTDGMLDFVISYQVPRSNRFTSWLCYEEDFSLVVPAGSELATLDSFSVNDLASLNLIYHNWSGSFTSWFFGIVPVNRWMRATIGSPSFVLSLVESGLGPALLTRSTVKDALLRGTVKELALTGHPLPPRWFTYFCATTRQLSRPPVRKWIDVMAKNGLPLLSF